MPEIPRMRLPFGQGLDRETGLQAVRPGSFEDLRNLLLHQGKMIPRPGFTNTLSIVDDVGDPVSHIVQAEALRSERVGVVVSYQQATQKVWVHRIDADGTVAQLLGEWVNDHGWGPNVPKVSMAESYARVFMAHDTPSITSRAPTIYYDPIFGAGALINLTGDFQTLGVHNIRFRGVVRHLKYLFGWGYGDESEDRPEFVRTSVAGDPTTFQTNHFFIAGDRRDAVLTARVTGRNLIVLKESEGHVVTGSGRDDFGIFLLDPLYGVLDTQLAENYSGLVVAWSAEGPRVWDGLGPSKEIAIPLDLSGPDPGTLVAEGLTESAFSHYLPDLRIVAFIFGRRVYALTVRIEGDWKWSYWELGFDPLCGFTLFTANVPAVPPPGYPTYVPPEGLPDTGTVPALVKQALMAVRVSDRDVNQPRSLPDRSGNGSHLHLGNKDQKDLVLGDGPFGIGKRGIIGTDQVDRGLGLPNTAQVLNIGAVGVNKVRVTINFSAHLDNGFQALASQWATAGNSVWAVQLAANGVIRASISEDGTAESTLSSTATLLVAGGFAHWDDIFLRVTWDFTADTAFFETSSDGIAWSALEAAASYGAARASLFQAAATEEVEIGGLLRGAANKLAGGGVYAVTAEEDSGTGFVQAWTWNGATAVYTDLQEIGQQTVAHASDPAFSVDHLRFDGVTSKASTWETFVGTVRDISDQFDIAAGESLTVMMYYARDFSNAGGPIGSEALVGKKLTAAAGNQGWGTGNNRVLEGFTWRSSDGATQAQVPNKAIVDDLELAVTIYEIDNAGAEIRMRQLGELPTIAVYNQLGTGTNNFGVEVGADGNGGNFATLDFYSIVVWKQKLTVAEMVTAGDWMVI